MGAFKGVHRAEGSSYWDLVRGGLQRREQTEMCSQHSRLMGAIRGGAAVCQQFAVCSQRPEVDKST